MRMIQAERQPQAQGKSSSLFAQAKCGCSGRCGCSGEAGGQAVARTGGQALPGRLRRRLEPLFQTSFSGVRLHDDRESHSAAAAVGARAFTQGQDIHFGASQYRPQQPEGLKLLAHELSHTIQQGDLPAQAEAGAPQALRVGPPSGALEQEADRAAERVMADVPLRVSGRVDSSLVQRAPPAGGGSGGTQAPPKVVPPVEPDKTQAKVIEDARRAAAIRSQIARFRTGGIAPDERTKERYKQEAKRLARIMFDWPNPNMEQVEEIVSGMAGSLTNAQVKVAGPGDPECGSRAGYVRGFRVPIVLCPGFFNSSAEQQIRTMIHEAAHLQGIGSASLGEGYCQFFTCDSSCPGGFDSADSWAQYVHCLSGQTADKPEEVKGKAGGSGP